MSDPVRLKTVFDATRRDPTGMFAAQLRLHVASWRANVTSAAGLTVTCIGEPPRHLEDYLRVAGAEIEVLPAPHRLAARSPIYNKHLAAPQDPSERVFLTDNDTVYLEDVASLARVPADTVAVSLSDNRRVTPELWEQLRSDAGVHVIPMDWVPWKERGLAAAEGRAPARERYAYFNGGAILFPAGRGFWDLWEDETVRLSAYFAAHGLDDRKDAGSDQLSLTSAAARHGSWQLLPEGYNVRPFHFWVREPVPHRVAHLHMVATSKVLNSMHPTDRRSLAAFVRHYWETMVYARVAATKRDLADALLGRLTALVADAELG